MNNNMNMMNNNNMYNMNMMNMMNNPNNMAYMNNMNYMNQINMMNMMNMYRMMQMNQNQTNKTLQRLQKEYMLCNQDTDLNQIGCTFGLVNENNLFQWKVSMIGPQGTPYQNGIFTILVFFPSNYPQTGAEFRFKNRIYHLNVDWRERDEKGNPGNGHICLSSLNEWRTTGKVSSKPGYGVKQALFDIFCLFYNQGIESPYDDNIALQYKNRRNEFDEIARQWTKQYAQ